MQESSRPYQEAWNDLRAWFLDYFWTEVEQRLQSQWHSNDSPSLYQIQEAHLMRHSWGANLPCNSALLEVMHWDVWPDVSIKVYENCVEATDGTEKLCHVIMRLNLHDRDTSQKLCHVIMELWPAWRRHLCLASWKKLTGPYQPRKQHYFLPYISWRIRFKHSHSIKSCSLLVKAVMMSQEDFRESLTDWSWQNPLVVTLSCKLGFSVPNFPLFFSSYNGDCWHNHDKIRISDEHSEVRDHQNSVSRNCRLLF